MSNKSPWTPEMEELLYWMRKDNIPFKFCTEVINREYNTSITTNASIGKFYRLNHKYTEDENDLRPEIS